MTWTPTYLHRVGHHCSWLDHRVIPEAAAMFAAMMSRVPKGGILARYTEVVEKIADGLSTHAGYPPISVLRTEPEGREGQYAEFMNSAEEHLCSYVVSGSLHPVIQEFFNTFVGDYGHASIKELTGRPVVFIEHISWWLAYLTFDNPLVRGQEMSTRAVWRRDWPMAGEVRFCKSVLGTRMDITESSLGQLDQDTRDLIEMHKLGLEIAWHETEAWKVELRADCLECGGSGKIEKFVKRDLKGTGAGWSATFEDTRKVEKCEVCAGTGKKYPWMNDPQAFRPAFDRARWPLPGTIETGVAHAGDVRTMGRVLKVMRDMATHSGQESALQIVEEIEETYRQAMPGMAGMWLREAVHDVSMTGRTPKSEPEAWAHQRQPQNAPIAGAAVGGWLPDDTPNVHRVGSPENPYVQDPLSVPLVQSGRMSWDGTVYTGAAIEKLREGFKKFNPIVPDKPQQTMSMGAKVDPSSIQPPHKDCEVHWHLMPDGRCTCPKEESTLSEKTTRYMWKALARHAVFQKLPGHLNMLHRWVGMHTGESGYDAFVAADGDDVEVTVCSTREYVGTDNLSPRANRRQYLDPSFNHYGVADVTIRCSLAAARDWHRHRPMMPWQLRVVRDASPTPLRGSERHKTAGGLLKIDHHYTPISDFGKANVERYIAMCTELHEKYLFEGNQWTAMLCLPLGTRVQMKGQGGLQHATYAMELRGWVAGGNFEYVEQARTAMKSIESQTNDLNIGHTAFEQDPEQGKH